MEIKDIASAGRLLVRLATLQSEFDADYLDIRPEINADPVVESWLASDRSELQRLRRNFIARRMAGIKQELSSLGVEVK